MRQHRTITSNLRWAAPVPESTAPCPKRTAPRLFAKKSTAPCLVRKNRAGTADVADRLHVREEGRTLGSASPSGSHDARASASGVALGAKTLFNISLFSPGSSRWAQAR